MMRFSLYIILLLLISSCASNNYVKFSPIYEKENFNDKPDYSNLIYRAAHPNKKDPSDSLPSIISKQYQPVDRADVFFIHPTTYLDSTKPYGWNASFKDMKTNIYTDYSTILNQASLFNIAGRVFAPRYRQAHIKSYSPLGHADTLKAIAAFELAYQDVKLAFEYYMKNENIGWHIIIASHSQGS
ncbi:MAG: DUF3089 domain-containing protein, partial [Sediminibacterium sp.]